jgi:hypothetical protein
MFRCLSIIIAGLIGQLTVSTAEAQVRPYIGFVYPAGGRQGTTFQVRLGGQNLDDVKFAAVSGKGVQAKILDYYRRLNPQDMALLIEQLKELKQSATMSTDGVIPKLMARIERRVAEHVATPACASISNLAFVEITISADAAPGQREIRLATPRGVSNPLVFQVGQLPEVCRKPMLSATIQILGKEELALRKRPDDEVEQRLSVPCVANGQVASGEVSRYRFSAHKGQRLLISVDARKLVPFIADAVPGWFQPVLALYDSAGKEVAYNDDYRFKPDPVIFFQPPRDGEYVFVIYDAIFRGREDFVYRATIGELPYVTSVFPLGAPVGSVTDIKIHGWNLDEAELIPPRDTDRPAVSSVAASKKGFIANRLPFAWDSLPECLEVEPNNDPVHAQKVSLPMIVNGRVNTPGDWDVFQFRGHAGDMVVAEVTARRLESPLDSVLKITDAAGHVLAINDDYEDAAAGVNTHDADSYLKIKLPENGTYYVHVGDTAGCGGEEYAYRLRISRPRPDFALFAVPSSSSFRIKGNNPLAIQVIRKDGFDGPIKLGLQNPPKGFSPMPLTLSGTQTIARLAVKTDVTELKQPVTLVVEGRAKIGGKEVVHEAVPAEDRMQAFLWRHLVPAEELKVAMIDPSYQPPRRVRQTPTPPPIVKVPTTPVTPPATPPKFTKQQVASRLKQIQRLFDEGYLTESFTDRKVAECEAAQ